MGQIHPEVERNFLPRFPQLHPLLEIFKQAFDITFASEKEGVFYWYLKPGNVIEKAIGYEKETLCVYAPYNELQQRTFSFLESLLDKSNDRLDYLAPILISDDPETLSKVHRYRSEKPDRPAIVSATKADLLAFKGEDAIRKWLIRDAYVRDLFDSQSPIRNESFFFGRDDTVSWLIDRFRRGENSGLFGLRRIGKTSVIFAVIRKIIKHSDGGAFYFDLNNVTIQQLRWWFVLQEIIKKITQDLRLERGERSKIIALSTQYDERNAAQHFNRDIHNILVRFPNKRILIALDEIEYITFGLNLGVGHWDQDYVPFWRTIRATHQETSNKFCFIVSGVNPKLFECPSVGKIDNPIFSCAKHQYLKPFNERDVRNMVRRLSRFMGLSVDEGLYSVLTSEYGGHPFLIRQACSHMAQMLTTRPEKMTVELFNANRDGINRSLESMAAHILNVLGRWYPDEYDMLTYLARGSVDTFKEFARDSAEFTQHVDGYGLVEDPIHNPRIRIKFIEDYLKKLEDRAPEASDDDITGLWGQFTINRNKIERELRRIMREALLNKYGKKSASVLYEMLDAKRRQELQMYAYDKIWAELYFRELIIIVKKCWDLVQTRFACDQKKFIDALECIADERVDAHAREIPKDRIAHVRYCFDLLISILFGNGEKVG